MRRRSGGANTTALLATFRLEIVESRVRFQTVALARLTVVEEIASVCIATVRVESLAFRVTALPPVASRRLSLPAFATVLLKLTVALWPKPLRISNAIAEAVIEPPLVPLNVAPFPESVSAAPDDPVAFNASGPERLIVPVEPVFAVSAK